MDQVFIVSGVRTAIGKFNGGLKNLSPIDLGAAVAKEALARAGQEQIDTAIFGNVIATEPRDMYLSRAIALKAGLAVETPALTLNRLCGSGLQAVVSAAQEIALGQANTALAGGAESMSRAGHLTLQTHLGKSFGDRTAADMLIGALTDPFGHGHMGQTAENVANAENITRELQDELALTSHHRASSAQKKGTFDAQILPIDTGKGRFFKHDEHIRHDLDLDQLSELRPAFRKDGSVTAGNSSGINDGAAALVLMNEDALNKSQQKPLARIVASSLTGVTPELMGMGPVGATQKVLRRANLKISDIDVIESNEAFAAQACAVAAKMGFDPTRLNPNGGAIALGHPIGATGAIILIKLIYQLHKTRGRYGLATMCIGGGQGISMIVEALH